MVVNPDQVTLQADPRPHTSGVPSGNYKYVIITKQDWVADFQPLADWRTKTGVPATIVTTDWITNDGGYSGGLDQKVNAFIQDAYATWGTTSFLLGGDTDTIPCHYTSVSDSIPNDTYYGDFDGDWTIEVDVGRASVTGTGTGNGGIGNFIAKQLKYEQNPEPDFTTKASMLGFNLDGSTPTEQCKQDIDNLYIPDTFNMTNVYDSMPGNGHATAVIAALNDGQNLVNHADHSGNDCMGTGYVNHGSLVYNSDMDALTNANRQGIYYSMGCDPASYDVGACIGEHFIRNDHGGGIAFIGNSRYGWYNPGNENSLSLKFDRLFFKAIFADGYTTLGTAYSAHKNAGVSGDSYDQYIYTELTLLGDPWTPIWTDTPGTLSVSYPAVLIRGTNSYTVTVTSGGNPVEGATVCLMKGTEVYQVGTTSGTGSVTLTPAPTTLGDMSVTVTKHNFYPAEYSATVISGGSKLEVSKVNGGINKVSASLQNPGNMTTTNVYWTMTLQAPLLLTGSRTHGTIASIAAGQTATVAFTPLLGFGPINITVTARADGISTMTKTANGFLFFFFITAK